MKERRTLRGSGVRSTSTGTPAARAVAVGATWSLPDRASTTSPVRGSGGVVAGRSGTAAATGPTGAEPGAAAGGAATVSSSGFPRSRPPTASVSVFGSTACSCTSTLISPASASGAAGTTVARRPAARPSPGRPSSTARSACGPSRATSVATAVASAGSADAPGVSSMGAPSATAAEAAPACPPASPSAASTTTGALVYSAALAATASGTGRGGREDGRGVGGCAEPASGWPPGWSASPCSRRAPRRTSSTRPPPGPATPTCAAVRPVYLHPDHQHPVGEPPYRPHRPTVGGPATLAQNYATGSLLRGTPVAVSAPPQGTPAD